MSRIRKIDLNVCKSALCPNLGIANASDYVWPVYRLGYAALECGKCGSLPPLFDETEYSAWFARLMGDKLGATGLGCPRCYTTEMIHYGQTRAGSARLQCRACRTVFTPQRLTAHQQESVANLLRRLDAGQYDSETTAYRMLTLAVNECERRLRLPAPGATSVATRIFTLPFQGRTAAEKIFVIVSADINSGMVLQISTNYCTWSTGEILRYRASDSEVPQHSHACTIEQVILQEKHFMQRSQFDEIAFGSARLKQNARGCIVRPVIAIHGHFQRLRILFPQVSDHFLAHECVLRGAAITAWSAEVRSAKTDLWFVVEENSDCKSAAEQYRLIGTWYAGWWNNRWQQWSQGENHKLISPLTGQKKALNPTQISLGACTRFIDWLEAHPWLARSNTLSARVVSLHLVCLAQIYNQTRHQGPD